jgi:hypothetical protein
MNSRLILSLSLTVVCFISGLLAFSILFL